MNKTVKQAVRFAIVGIVSNTIGFGWYVLLTWLGMGPKAAMSLLFVIGTLQTFVFNKRWSFGYKQKDRAVLFRYFVTYGTGYLVNLAGLIVLVERYGLPHYWVQAGLIVTVAILTFVLQKFWVFSSSDKSYFFSERIL